MDESRGDADTARARFALALDEIEALPIPLDRARLLTWQGRFLYRQGDLRSARRSFATAHQLADSRGAGLIAGIASSELRHAGGRVRSDRRQAGELTSRQSQVADLASVGRTSVEIAGELGITTRTVEHHLDAVYRQLGIRSRRDLMRMRFSGEFPLGDR